MWLWQNPRAPMIKRSMYPLIQDLPQLFYRVDPIFRKYLPRMGRRPHTVNTSINNLKAAAMYRYVQRSTVGSGTEDNDLLSGSYKFESIVRFPTSFESEYAPLGFWRRIRSQRAPILWWGVEYTAAAYWIVPNHQAQHPSPTCGQWSEQ
jgi:hypothetical protein